MKVHERSKNTEILYKITQAVHPLIDLEEIFKIAMDMTISLENVDMAMIYLVDEVRKEAVIQAQRNLPEDYLIRAERIPFPRGITWKVINSCKILNIENAQDDPDIGPAGRDLGHHGVLGIPVILEQKGIGVIWLLSYEKHKFTDREIDLLSSIGNQIAIAISKAKLYRELSKKSRYETIVSTVSRSVHKSIELKDVLENAASVMSNNIDNLNSVGIYLVEDEVAIMKAYSGFSDFYVERAGRIPRAKGYTWKTIREGKPTYVEDVEKDNIIGPAGRQEGIMSYLSMPLHYNGDVIGCININSSKKSAFDDEELKLLGIVAQQIGVAINNAKQVDALKRSEESLRNSEERYRSLYEDNPSMYFTVDSSGNVLSVNQFGADQFGYNVEELVGSPVLDMIYEEDKQEVLNQLNTCLQNIGKVYHQEFRKVRKDGTLIWVKEICRAVRDNNGHPVILIVCEDITESRQLYEKSILQTEELKALYENLNKRNKDLEILNAITQAVHRSIDLDEVYKTALDMTIALDNIDMSLIYLVDKDRKEAVLQAHRNIPEDYLRRAGRIPYPKGITWRVINSGEIMNIKDIQKDPNIGSAGRDLGHHGILGMPIALHETVIGVIWMFSYEEYEFSSQEIDLLTSIGNQIAIAVAKAKFYKELSKKNRYEKIINSVTRSVHSSIDFHEVLENAVEAIENNIYEADQVAIHFVEGDEAVLKSYRNLGDEYIQRAWRIPYPKGATWKTIIDGKPFYCSDTDNESIIGTPGRKLEVKSFLCMPIKFEGKVVGSLNVASYKKGAFDDEELNLLGIVTQQIEVAISNAKQAELLRESKERYLTLVEHTYDITCEVSVDGYFLYVSPNHKEVLGYDPGELLGKRVFEHVHPEDRQTVICEFTKAIKTFSSGNAVFRYKNKNGKWLWLKSTGKPFRTSTGDIRAIIASRDITKQVLYEEEMKNTQLQLRALAARLQSVREEERTRIAREIHDELGQMLTGLNMSLHWLSRNLRSDDKDNKIPASTAVKEIEIMSNIVDTAILKVQDISSELRPVILDDFGIVPAIKSQMKEFNSRSGIKCEFTTLQGDMLLDSERSTALFRIFQEIMTNVARHSKATRVDIDLHKESDHVILEIRDNGNGIRESDIYSSKSLGLLGIKERASNLGGSVIISGKKGEGTTVSVQIPLDQPEIQ